MSTATIFIGLALIFGLGKVILEKRLAHLDAGSDERRLGDLAFTMGCSTYDLFVQAGDVWNFSKTKIDADFRDYVHSERIPTYVLDFLDNNQLANDQTYQIILFSGGRPPYL
jgi:hypothetical protein